MGSMISSVATLVGMIATQSKEDRADKKEEKARELERKEAEARNRREQIQQLAKAKVLRAEIRAGAVTGGVTGSSGAEGGSSSIYTQGAANAGFISQLDAISKARSAAINKAISLRKSAAKFRAYNQALGNIGAAAASWGTSSGSPIEAPQAPQYSIGGGGGAGASTGQSINPFFNNRASFNSGMRF